MASARNELKSGTRRRDWNVGWKGRSEIDEEVNKYDGKARD
jgi:hypothetical protein